jgi:simple sugar transport system ATP-binding protein
LILAVNPTRGLDIGAIEFVYAKLNQFKLAGKAILLISTELQEILTLSDRIAVIFRGAIVHTRENEGVNIEEIGAYMAGITGRVL